MMMMPVHCPNCEYPLAGLPPRDPAGSLVCPECGLELTPRDLWVLQHAADPAGKPRSINPRERVVRGPVLLFTLLVTIAGIVILIQWFLTLGR